MTLSEAINIVEGVEDAKNSDHYFAAWQYLIDTGQAWRLQGWYGRTALQMIEDGHCHA